MWPPPGVCRPPYGLAAEYGDDGDGSVGDGEAGGEADEGDGDG